MGNIYRLLEFNAELQNQDKQIILCKVLAHIEIKGNEGADKAENQAIGIPWMIITILLLQTTTWPSWGLKSLNGKGRGKTAVAN